MSARRTRFDAAYVHNHTSAILSQSMRLVDSRHRISYLRVSITDRCNERCNYCMPQELQEWLPRHEILTYEETLRLIRIAAPLGVSKLRITGGEPLTRRDVVHFVRQLPEIHGIRSIGLST